MIPVLLLNKSNAGVEGSIFYSIKSFHQVTFLNKCLGKAAICISFDRRYPIASLNEDILRLSCLG